MFGFDLECVLALCVTKKSHHRKALSWCSKVSVHKVVNDNLCLCNLSESIHLTLNKEAPYRVQEKENSYTQAFFLQGPTL